MYEVEELFAGDPCRTKLWVSVQVSRAISDFALKNRRSVEQLLKRLQHYTKNGFSNYEGDGPIRYEWDGVYRIGHKSNLFRIIGFYDGGKTEFIAIEAFTKHGQKLSKPEKNRINEVVRVKEQRLWR